MQCPICIAGHATWDEVRAHISRSYGDCMICEASYNKPIHILKVLVSGRDVIIIKNECWIKLQIMENVTGSDEKSGDLLQESKHGLIVESNEDVNLIGHYSYIVDSDCEELPYLRINKLTKTIWTLLDFNQAIIDVRCEIRNEDMDETDEADRTGTNTTDRTGTNTIDRTNNSTDVTQNIGEDIGVLYRCNLV